MDDRAAALLREEIVEELAAGVDRSAVDAIAAHFTGDDLSRLTEAIARNRDAFGRPVSEAEVQAWFGANPATSVAQITQKTFLPGDADLLQRLRRVLQRGSTNDVKAAERMLSFDPNNPGLAELETLFSVFLTGSGAADPYTAKAGKFPTKASREELGADADALDALMIRVEHARERLNCVLAADKTVALYRFASAFLPAYEARKQARGWLDFDDLILRTQALLSDPAVAGWVLYRLDGGLDHILVDEAQDTSPAQWNVIERLAQEFTAGQGARDDVRRSIFVVGDKKQSIYSFQGADPREFDRMRDFFGGRLRELGVGLRNLDLEFSFRSSDAILRFVEAAAPDGFSETRHRAFHGAMPGRVDLWPAVPKAESPEQGDWYDPVDMRAEAHHETILAKRIAGEIARLIGTETLPRPDGSRRRISAGDILILVRRRSALFEELIRACKALGLPVAGADRLKLGGELAVKDLAALLSFLATPEDDLSLAAALKSPLFGWTEADLYDLAAGRTQTYLWAALRDRAAEYPDTVAALRELRNAADFLRPYDLIERVLIRHDGRRRLLARLGPEAEDGIDALVAQSLAYERMEIPSLTGFLGWLQTDDVEVKRQMDSAGDQVRVMTVHGAKGLESPVVILPDTAKRPLPVRDEVISLDRGEPVWRVASERQPEAMVEALNRLKAAQDAEAMRLFYVAVTRAETWLIVAAAGDTGNPGESWHGMALHGLESLGALPHETPVGTGLRYGHGDWSAGAISGVETGPDDAPESPAWTRIAAAPVCRPPQPLSPSNLGGAKAIGGIGGQEEDAALRHGTCVHRLLEHLPRYAKDRWTDVAMNLLQGEDEEPAHRAFDEARRVLTDPDLAQLFGEAALSEVGITAALDDLDGLQISGAVDKLIVGPDRILAVDFKTNATVPATPGETPEGLLRQMGAYAAGLRAIYPDRPVNTAILWTRVPLLMPLPHDIVSAALQRTPTS